MKDKSLEKAWDRWESEKFDRNSFEVGYYEGRISARRFFLIQAFVIPLFIGGVCASIIMWWAD